MEEMTKDIKLEKKGKNQNKYNNVFKIEFTPEEFEKRFLANFNKNYDNRKFSFIYDKIINETSEIKDNKEKSNRIFELLLEYLNKRFNTKTPVGLQDNILTKMEKKNKIESVLKNLFLNSGYNLVETPTLEYVDVFTTDLQDKSLYKLINKDGEVLALRSDVTKSIARVVSTETKDFTFPQRFCYIANTFRYPKAYQGKQHEFTQAGVELIGCDGVYADYEIVSLAVKSLNSVLNDYKLYISSTEFFNNYLDDLNITKDLKEKILEQIKNKNVVKIKELLDENSYELLSLIIEAIGKKDLLLRIRRRVAGKKTLESLLKLEKLYDLLEDNGLEKNVFFDFSILSYGDYYTGITLQGYTKGIGTPILEGGRYNRLLEKFGEEKEACGFAINVNDLIGKTMLTYERDVKMLFSKDYEKAIKNIDSENSFVSLERNIEDAKKYGITNNIKTIVDIDESKIYVLKEGEYVCQE